MRTPQRHHPAAPLRREIQLDFIRGVAILLVLDFHNSYPMLAPIFNFLHLPHLGWVGVEMFFVLSGFLVGGLLMKEWAVRRGVDSTRFLIRRAFKIWPQYYLFILAMLLTRHLTFKRSIGNLLNIQNYIPGVSHTWSLAIEEHVYLFLVACFVLASRKRVPVRSVFLFFVSVCVAEVALRYLLGGLRYDIFFPTHTRMDGILYGVLLAMLYHFAPARFERLRSIRLFWCICLFTAILILGTSERAGWRGALHQDAANLFSIAVLLLLYRKPKPGHVHSLVYRGVAWIGLYSYGIYLWHVIFIHTVTAFGESHPHIPHLLLAVVIAILGIFLGALTTRIIEIPALHLRDRLFPKRIDSAVGIPAQIEAPQGTLVQL